MLMTRGATSAQLTRNEFQYDCTSRKLKSKKFTWDTVVGTWTPHSETWRVFDRLDVVQERNELNQVTA